MAFKILGRDGVNLTTAGSDAQHLSAESRKIVNVVNPTDAQDVATKDYVDNATTAASSALDGTFRIKNTADQTKQTAFDISAVATGTTRTIVMPNANVNLGLVASAIQSSEKGANNGVAELGGDGKILSAQLPAIAITDTFVVASQVAMLALTVETGDVAVRTDLNKSFILAGTDPAELADWQELLTPTSAVVSVNGQTGTVSLDSDDISEGSTNLYYTSARFDSALSAKSTSDLSEGTNLYFTQSRVLNAELTGLTGSGVWPIADTDTVLEGFDKISTKIGDIVQSVADEAQNIIDVQGNLEDHENSNFDAHDASAISVADSANKFTGINVESCLEEVIDAAIAAQADADQAISDAGAAQADATQALADASDAQADASQALSESGQAFSAGVAGESFAADQVWLVRRAKNGETAGRYYKASADSAINSRVVGFIVVGASAVSASDNIRVYKLGSAILGSSDSAFAGANINLPIFLHQSTAGKWTLSPSETAGQWLKEVGFVGSTTEIEFQPGMLIQA